MSLQDTGLGRGYEGRSISKAMRQLSNIEEHMRVALGTLYLFVAKLASASQRLVLESNTELESQGGGYFKLRSNRRL